MDKMKVGVVGVGAIGRNHARIYSESHAAELSAIFDSDAEAAREISSQYGTCGGEPGGIMPNG